MAAFGLKWQSWIVSQDTLCYEKPKILTIWSFMENAQIICIKIYNTPLLINITEWKPF